MTVISSKEFATNQNKYFELAMNEQVYIENGENIFHLSCTNTVKDKYLEPDKDFYRAISIDDFQSIIKEDIHQWYKERDENNSITRS